MLVYRTSTLVVSGGGIMLGFPNADYFAPTGMKWLGSALQT